MRTCRYIYTHSLLLLLPSIWLGYASCCCCSVYMLLFGLIMRYFDTWIWICSPLPVCVCVYCTFSPLLSRSGKQCKYVHTIVFRERSIHLLHISKFMGSPSSGDCRSSSEWSGQETTLVQVDTKSAPRKSSLKEVRSKTATLYNKGSNSGNNSAYKRFVLSPFYITPTTHTRERSKPQKLWLSKQFFCALARPAVFRGRLMTLALGGGKCVCVSRKPCLIWLNTCYM